jgi:hypothetical protein
LAFFFSTRHGLDEACSPGGELMLCLTPFHNAAIVFAVALMFLFAWHFPSLIGLKVPPSKAFFPLRSYAFFIALCIILTTAITIDEMIRISTQSKWRRICSSPGAFCEFFPSYRAYGNYYLREFATGLYFGAIFILSARFIVSGGYWIHRKAQAQ